MGERMRRAVDWWAAPTLVFLLGLGVAWMLGRLWGWW